MTDTGRALDVALEGRAMLAVQTADGSEGYTRRGDLTISATGVLENGDGLPVLGDAGPITVPPGSDVKIAPDGGVLVADPATPTEPPQRLDRLKLVSVEGSKIEKGLDGQFRVVGGGALPSDENARLVSGALEQSNVNSSRSSRRHDFGPAPVRYPHQAGRNRARAGRERIAPDAHGWLIGSAAHP